MSNSVYYLSFYIEGGGFLFPDELPPNYYSPGLFLIKPNQDGSYPYAFSFDAMDNGKRISLKLVRANEGDPNSRLYVVRTQHYGSFWFNLEAINPTLPYIGNRPQLKTASGFSMAITTDATKLERVCHNFDFYFIGNTFRQND